MVAQPRSRAELLRVLAACCEEPGHEEPGHEDDGPSGIAALGELVGLTGSPDRATHTELFVLELPPHASIYLSHDGMLGGKAAASVGGFWRALGIPVPREPDHLSALLALYASLLEAEDRQAEVARRDALGRARATLLFEHLLSWLPLYLPVVARRAGGFYASWASLLEEVITAEADELFCAPAGHPAALGTTARGLLPEGLRGPPDPPTPEEGGRQFVSALLTPVRSGMLLTRTDLAGLARQIGAGLRMGERRFMLENLLDQYPAEVICWIREQAGSFETLHASRLPVLGYLVAAWRDRAAATGSVLEATARRLIAAEEA